MNANQSRNIYIYLNFTVVSLIVVLCFHSCDSETTIDPALWSCVRSSHVKNIARFVGSCTQVFAELIRAPQISGQILLLQLPLF